MRRRTLLQSSAALLGGALFGGPIHRTMASPTLRPSVDAATGLSLLELPEGFRYTSFSWRGDPLFDRSPTPGFHDGMGVVARTGSRVTLVRNHELDGRRPFGRPNNAPVYDDRCGGGTTTLIFDTGSEKLIEARASLTGTLDNCCGGVTPWGTWLTCEENTAGPETGTKTLPHGLVFEVDPNKPNEVRSLPNLGRFIHEAAAVDPKTGSVYLTEDVSRSGLYRFTPRIKNNLASAGKLEMMAIKGKPNYDLGAAHQRGARFDVSWLPIDDPTRAHSKNSRDSAGVFTQGFTQGGAIVRRGEGCWFDRDQLYFVSTDGGLAGLGQVWKLDVTQQRVELLVESRDAALADHPDNITGTPNGGLLLCEDGNRHGQQLLGLDRNGQLFPFARNAVRIAGRGRKFDGDHRDQEWAGACFSQDWLFVNIQVPGITFAITGPWSAVGL